MKSPLDDIPGPDFPYKILPDDIRTVREYLESEHGIFRCVVGGMIYDGFHPVGQIQQIFDHAVEAYVMQRMLVSPDPLESIHQLLAQNSVGGTLEYSSLLEGLQGVHATLKSILAEMQLPNKETAPGKSAAIQDVQRRVRRILANPTNYKVCEGCDSVVAMKVSTCPNCRAYRFEADPDFVVRHSKILAAKKTSRSE